jgi:hypothetical protein
VRTGACCAAARVYQRHEAFAIAHYARFLRLPTAAAYLPNTALSQHAHYAHLSLCLCCLAAACHLSACHQLAETIRETSQTPRRSSGGWQWWTQNPACKLKTHARSISQTSITYVYLFNHDGKSHYAWLQPRQCERLSLAPLCDSCVCVDAAHSQVRKLVFAAALLHYEEQLSALQLPFQVSPEA